MAMPVARIPNATFVPHAAREVASLPAAIRADGIELLPLRPALSSLWHALRLLRATGYDELGHALAMFTAGIVDHARAVAATVRDCQADVVVADYLFVAAWLGARLAGRPFAAFFHSALPFASVGGPPFGSGIADGAPGDPAWRDAQRRLDLVTSRAEARVVAGARRLGLDTPRSGFLGRPYSDDVNLLATLPELEPGLAPLEGPVEFTGPCLGGRAQEDPTHPALQALGKGRRHAYVSLGTVFNDNPRVFEELLRGLDMDGVRVIVSAGASAEHLQRSRVSANCDIFVRVPQVALLDRVDVVVTHGGNNTTLETLAAGKPMLVIPFGGDQIQNAWRVRQLGVGLSLQPARATRVEVRAAATKLFAEAKYRDAAARAAAALTGVDGSQRAGEAILALAQARR